MKMKNKSITITVTKFQKKTRKNNKKTARIRRQRGYHWEDTIVKRFNSANNWNAFRLGSPSIALPDVLAVNTPESMIFAIEAKSGTTNSLPVPADQIERCLKWINVFEIYKERKVILAFKFLSKKRIGLGIYESRELREFYKIWDNTLGIIDCNCNYEGKMFARINGKRTEINLKEYKMPFKTKHRITA